MPCHKVWHILDTQKPSESRQSKELSRYARFHSQSEIRASSDPVKTKRIQNLRITLH